MIVSAKQLNKESCAITFNITNASEKYILVNHYDTIIAKGHIDSSEALKGIEICSSAHSNSDFKAINEAFKGLAEVRKIKGVPMVKLAGQDKWEVLAINTNLDVFHIND